MPIYEYECVKCGNVDEVLQKFSDKPLSKCKRCSGKLHRLISHSSFHLKGTGWYANDYANKSHLPSSSPVKASSASTGETKNTDKKTKKSDDTADKAS